YFNNTPREVHRRLIYCRTRHAFLGEYYAKFVPTESIQCPCGARNKLEITSSKFAKYTTTIETFYGMYDLGQILGTEEGIEALAELRSI
ncbi:hypothetical protein C8J55DRAFT_431798, partial [Lentinula edodes]